MLQPSRGLQTIEQVIAADEHAVDGGQRVLGGYRLGWRGADLV